METWLKFLLIALDIVGVIVFFYLIHRIRYRRSLKEREEFSHVNHYKKVRDQVTVRKEDNNYTESASNGSGFIVGSVVSLVVGTGVCMIVLVFVGMLGSDLSQSAYNMTNQDQAVTDSLNAISGVANYLPIITMAVVIAIILALILGMTNFSSSDGYIEKPKVKKKMKHKDHYKKLRDDLTKRKETFYDEEETEAEDEEETTD